MSNESPSYSFIVLCVIGFIVSLLLAMWAFPQWRIYKNELRGKAALKEAQWNRKIQVEESEAVAEAAVYLKKAAITDAEAVAEANKIIGQSLKQNEEYLRFLWIKGLHDGSSEVIYVPTETNLPILEATRKIQ